MTTRQNRWWEKDEDKQWLKENDWLEYAKRYLPHYDPSDDFTSSEAGDESE